MYLSQQVKVVNDADYDSYSSEDENRKTTVAKLNSTMNIINTKNGLNKIKSPQNSKSEIISLSIQERNERIAEKLYMPFIKDKIYKLDVNKKLPNVKEDTKNSAIISHKLMKSKEEVEKIGKQLFIYNNPSKFFYFIF